MRFHQGRVDKNGNFKDRSEKEAGMVRDTKKELPFPALVTAWYPKSQEIDVIAPTDYGNVIINRVQIYGNFFESVGTIHTPKIATKENIIGDAYTTTLQPDQKISGSPNYVLDNHIEAIVKPYSEGYYASEFRFISSDSLMLNNAEYGRKIVRHDDGAYYIHDEDGNMQFMHPSGLKLRIGDSDDDIELEEPFPEHAKNKLKYVAGIKCYVEYPLGGQTGYDNNGKILFSNPIGAVKTDILDAMLDHHTNTLDYLDQTLTEYISHNHPCIVPTGTPITASTAVSIQIDVQLEMTNISATKTLLGQIMA